MTSLIGEEWEAMMIPSSDRTVRDVVLELPHATRVFEKLKIDYCCGGDTPLTETCANAGVKVENLERMLAEVGQADGEGNGAISLQKGDFQKRDFRTATLAELIGHILDKHHVYAKEEMVRLEALIDKVIGAHGENHPELLRLGSLFQQLCDDLKPHMFKEEQILFPYIIEMERSALQKRQAPFAPFGTVNNPIRMMMMEHDTVGGLLRDLRALSSNYAVPRDGCISYQTLYQALEAFEKDLHQHIHLENNILFPRAIEMEANLGSK
jgi:regulator of cell morphogenesis and NO signaling